MNTKIILTSLLVAVITMQSKAQYYEWANKTTDELSDIAVNSNGTVAVSGGSYTGFGSFNNGFVKWGTNNVSIVSSALASHTTIGNVAIDYAGNVYVAGLIQDGSNYINSIGGVPITSGSFIAKLNTSGNGVWVKNLLDANSELARVTADSAGNVYVVQNDSARKYNSAGVLKWKVATLHGANIAVDALRRVYVSNSDSVIKYNTLGAIVYTKPYGGIITVNKDGNVFLLNSGSVTKLNLNGNIAWTNSTIGGIAIAVDKNNSAYIINSSGVNKLNLAGTNILWTQTGDNVFFQHLSIDGSNNVYAAGYWNYSYPPATYGLLCPFKMEFYGISLPFPTNFTTKISQQNPAPFQAAIITGHMYGTEVEVANLTPLNIPYSYCLAGSSAFAPNNEFRGQIIGNGLSSPVDLGLATNAVIPAWVPEGDYQFQVISTNPPATFTYANTSELPYNVIHVWDKSLAVSAAGSTTICSGDSVLLTATYHSHGNYYWRKIGNSSALSLNNQYYAKQTGSYYCEYWATSNADTISTSINVTVNAKPAATITPQGPTTFCAGGSVILAANTGVGLTYKWKKYGNYLAGATSLTYTATTAGTYRVEVTNSNGCSRTSQAITVTINCRESNDETINDNKNNVTVCPNSSTAIFCFNGLEKDNVVNVYDVNGRLISSTVFNYNSSIDLSQNKKGMYFYKVVSGDQNLIAQGKLILN